MNKDKEKFGIVVCDPPAFAKVKKDIAAGLRGYRKVARLAAGLVEKTVFWRSGRVHITSGRTNFSRNAYAV